MRRGLFILVGLVAGCLLLSQAVSLSSPIQVTPEISAQPPVPPPLSSTDKEGHRKALEAGGHVRYLSGPTTRGAVIPIAGRAVRLPPDALVAKFVVGVDCMPGGPCPDELPFLVIERGASWAWVGLQSGRVFLQRTAPGEAAAFDFLHKEVRP